VLGRARALGLELLVRPVSEFVNPRLPGRAGEGVLGADLLQVFLENSFAGGFFLRAILENGTVKKFERKPKAEEGKARA